MPPFTFLENVAEQVVIPEAGIVSRTVFDDEALKIVAFGFSPGHEMPSHVTPMAIVLYVVQGQLEVMMGDVTKPAGLGALVHMAPRTPHSILAKTGAVMLLLMLKLPRVL